KGGGKERATAKGEDDQVVMYRADTPEAEPGQVAIERRLYQLCSEDDGHQPAQGAPDQRQHGEFANDIVVVTGLRWGARGNGRGVHDYSVQQGKLKTKNSLRPSLNKIKTIITYIKFAFCNI